MKRIIALLMVLVMALSTPVFGEDCSDIGQGTCGFFRDSDGNRYLVINDRVQYGRQTWKNGHYYAYQTSRPGKPRGSLCTDSFRRYGKNNWIYYRYNGKALRHHTPLIKLYPSDMLRVRHIYVPGSNFTWRYNCYKERMEKRSNRKSRDWRETGMQFYWDYDKQR